MNRAELVKELRQCHQALATAVHHGYRFSVVTLMHSSFQALCNDLESAAAALEEADKDARRYELLFEAACEANSGARSWCVKNMSSDKPCLRASRLPLGKDSPDGWPEGRFGWYNTLEDALNAYLKSEK